MYILRDAGLVYIYTSVKSFHKMKGDRDGKSAKSSATRNCL